ncbi:hypothetical protein SSX86_023950 [Deinandra increscens subsp. villosa]|uniref:Uncharacterized protein n=1 Tax=Deinandra increscens subsp. villosa TaxID=3103831 RepID=A0AAP0CNK8_9ASTR
MGGRPEIHNQYASLIISDLLHTVISSTVANQPPISSTVANQPPPSLTSAVLTTIAADLAPSLQCPSLAEVLDPRNKMHYLGYSLTLKYGKDSKEEGEIKTLVKNTLMELFEHYKSKIGKEKEAKGTPSVATNLVDDDESDDDQDGYQKYLEEQDLLSNKKARKDFSIGDEEDWN